ncbi:MAG: hypothetical protein AUH72_05065 [Acidobacteria bacterium 13_1_40CM_4_65_8]|nr:MAG: hypothetical protein AUH72_05065 [Acidobacteria bacterium 13_1_40CM_4_65_8]
MTAVAIVALLTAGWLQGTSATAPVRTATIKGRVVRADGRALARVRVRLMISQSGPPLVTETDLDGQFEFNSLRAGTYTLAASKPGYVDVEFAQRRWPGHGQPITVAVGETRDRVDLVLPRTAAIVGRVVDEDGEPVEGAGIAVLESRLASGRRRLVPVQAAGGRTNDQGRFRVYGLKPGRYYVSATVGQTDFIPSNRDLPGYAPTYFPGTPNPAEAQAVALGLSQDASGIDFAIVPMRTASVSGTAFQADGAPVVGGLRLVSSQRSGLAISMNARIDPDGSFEFPNVAPGEYVVQMFKSRPNTYTEGEFASALVTVSGANVTGLSLHAAAGSTITGRITLDGSGTIRPNGVELVLTSIDADLSSPESGATRAEIHEDWTFRLAGISGPRRLRVVRTPAGWMVKAIFVNGIDVTDTPLPFGTRDQSLSDVDVVLTNRITQVSGTVTDARGDPATDAMVVAFSTDRDRWYPESRFFDAARIADGKFTLRGLPSGDYFVVAIDEGSDWQEAALLDLLTTRATRVTLSDGQQTAVNLKVTGR